MTREPQSSQSSNSKLIVYGIVTVFQLSHLDKPTSLNARFSEVSGLLEKVSFNKEMKGERRCSSTLSLITGAETYIYVVRRPGRQYNALILFL